MSIDYAFILTGLYIARFDVVLWKTGANLLEKFLEIPKKEDEVLDNTVSPSKRRCLTATELPWVGLEVSHFLNVDTRSPETLTLSFLSWVIFWSWDDVNFYDSAINSPFTDNKARGYEKSQPDGRYRCKGGGEEEETSLVTLI